jgi:hypothetical protein
MVPIVKAAKSANMRCSIVGDCLFLNGKKYTKDSLKDLPANLSPQNLATRSNDHALAFFGRASPLSNFYPADFVVNGNSYSSSEQFYQAQKAQFAKDRISLDKIMQHQDPTIHKKIGDQVKIDQDLWVQKAPEVMHCGLLAKFSQNKDLAIYLSNTGNKVLLESSAKDSIWGTGVSLTHKNVLNTDLHTGRNLLGNILMSVRQQLSFSHDHLIPPSYPTSPVSSSESQMSGDH